MFDQNLITQAKEEIDAAKSVAVLLPPEPSTDQVAAALGLFLSLQEAGKQAQIGCGSDIKVENANLFGVDKIKNSIGNQNLIITFDFKEENLKKVDYDVDENGKFMLLVQPQPGCEPPDTSSINYSYSGASADLVFAFGINSLEELGKIYADEKAFLDKAKIVTLGTVNKPSNFAAASFHSHGASGSSEIVAFLLKSWDVKPSPDAANNLLTMISEATNQFTSPKTTADTFEIIAFLMRSGARPGHSSHATSSRFGAFPPNPAFGGSPFGASPFMGGMGGPMMPPTFDDDDLLPPPPPSFNPPSLPPRPSEAFGVGGPRPAGATGQSSPRRSLDAGGPRQVPNNWKKRPQIFKGGQSGLNQS